MTRRRTWMAGALAALAVLAGLTACTPASKRVTALRAVDGRPVLLIVSCAQFRAYSVSVYTIDASTPTPRWRVERSGGEVPEEVRLLDAPAGWTVTERSLTEFAPGAEYAVSTYDRNARDAVPIHFTPEELAALGPGEVLVGESASRRRAVSEAKFRAEAKDSCRS